MPPSIIRDDGKRRLVRYEVAILSRVTWDRGDIAKLANALLGEESGGDWGAGAGATDLRGAAGTT